MIQHLKRVLSSWPVGLFAALLVLAVSTPSARAQDAYSIGIVPQFEARKLTAIWTPILEEVSKRAGVTLTMQGSPKIPEFEKHFAKGDFDFAYMNPYHALVAHAEQGYEPIIRDGGRELFGVLVVRKDAPYKTVEDLRGKNIAFPAPNALGASLLMRAVLQREHALSYEANFVNTHSSAYFNVVLGEAAAAGGVMGTLRSLDPKVRDQLRVLFETPRLPPHPIMVHPRVPLEVRNRVAEAFLALAASPEGQKLMERIPMRAATPATMQDYDKIRKLDLDAFYQASDPTD